MISVPSTVEENATLSTRNVNNGHAWTALSNNGQMVFSTRLFHALAGVPNLEDYDTDDEPSSSVGDGKVGQTNVTVLTDDEEARYRPLYEELVDEERVAFTFARTRNGETLAKHQRKSLRCVRKLAHQVCS